MLSKRFASCVMLLLFCTTCFGQEISTGQDRVRKNQHFHVVAQQRTGVLIPMYIYPTEAEAKGSYSRLIDLKRRYETVPFWVIVNPGSGPGSEVDPNYSRVIQRLVGAGCVVLGYVSTSYAKRPAEDVEEDIRRWAAFYPRVHGLFLDEMINEDREEAVEFQSALRQLAHRKGFWPIVANPGTTTPGRYFDADVADVIVVHEGNRWPEEPPAAEDASDGSGDSPPGTRAVLVHSMPRFDKNSLHIARKYARWVYVTEDLYRPNDPAASNPWDTLSAHLEATCEELSR